MLKLKLLLDLAVDIGNADFTKYQRLVRYLKDKETGWNKKDPSDRLVIFTERIETKRFLVETLAKDLGLDPKAVASIDGRMKDVDIMQVVEQFGLANSPLRILVASDVASEGINLHYFAHRLVHFDIPWSLITFQQRNGRIDRYGQKAQPVITFLLSSVDGTQDDLNVMRHVIGREINAHDNIGDPGQLMGVYDAAEEENIVARAYQAVRGGAEVIAALDAQIAGARGGTGPAGRDSDAGSAALPGPDDDFDLMDLVGAGDTPFAENPDNPVKSPHVATTEPPSIFRNESDYLAAGLSFMQSVSSRKYGELTRDGRTGLLRLPVTENLGSFCRHVLPYELRRQVGESGELLFTTDPKAMQAETDLARSRALVSGEDGERREAWPRVSYLWPLNPVSQWITENVNATFGSQSAPVLKVAGAAGPAFLVYAYAPNEHGEPLVQGWFTVTFRHKGHKGRKEDLEVRAGGLDELIRPFGLDRPGFANAAGADEKLDDETLTGLNDLRAPAIDAVRARLDEMVSEYEKTEGPRNGDMLKRLDERYDKVIGQLEFDFMRFDPLVQKLRRGKYDEARLARRRAYENFRQWAKAHRRPVAYRHCQIVAVFVGHKEHIDRKAEEA